MENDIQVQRNDKVLVVGGGIGGIRTALDLAEAGHSTVIIDTANAIGGLMTRLDRTFPTNNCDLCTLSPELSDGSRHRHIELMTLTRLVRLDGEAGDFTATLFTAPRYIDLDLCTACGECLKRFPECVRFAPGLDHRAPTCMRYPQVTPQAFFIDMERCTDVNALVECCPAGAILPEDSEREHRALFGAVVLAMGADVIDPAPLDHFGYGSHPDIVTSLEYERILSASGPTAGRLLRPSDGKPPQKIAWIQCVGSRSVQKGSMPYCSSACCMFALKEAMVTKERFQDSIETTVFFMDMRTFGKDYERYYERARNDYGIRFVRSRPHSVFAKPGGEALTVGFFTCDGDLGVEEEFDLVVLSTGFSISPQVREMMERLGVETNPHGFALTSSFDPVASSRPGVYTCGLFESPKDIPDTMIQASAAACRAAMNVQAGGRSSDETETEVPPERDVSGEAPRVGVFICRCGEDIGGVIDVDRLASYARTVPGVRAAEVVGHGCSREAMDHIREVIHTGGLNRVVIGGCSPRTHELRFQEMVRQAGLNRYLVQIANLRDQDTWVHRNRPAQAAEKARELIRIAVSGVSMARPLNDHILPMNQDVLVVGGGVSGLTAAVRLADQGRKVYLAERSARLGGVAAGIRRTLEGEDPAAYVGDLIRCAETHENIQVITQAIIVDHSGLPGMFKTGLQTGPQMFYRQISHGAVILATGALPNRPADYLLGNHPSVLTQLEADALIEDQPDRIRSWKNVAMIQCVGSRTAENPNCSRICCQTAIKNALRILDVNPEAQIFILYRDMRTYGFQEEYYRKARERGVIFARFEPENPPLVSAEGDHVRVTFTDLILGRPVTMAADAVCLSTGMISDDEATEDLASIFKLPRTRDGYFLEEHVKLRPVDLPVPGFFVAGTAHAPKSIRESIAQAEAAAARAQTLLAREVMNLGAAVAKVDSSKCAACLFCVRACPYGVPTINADGYSEIDPSKCHGCGVCASECPAKAIQLMRFEDDQILAELDGLLDLLERKVA